MGRRAEVASAIQPSGQPQRAVTVRQTVNSRAILPNSLRLRESAGKLRASASAAELLLDGVACRHPKANLSSVRCSLRRRCRRRCMGLSNGAERRSVS